MYLVTIVLVGLALGALAKFLNSGPSSPSVVTTMILGVAGALVVGLIARTFGWYQTAYHVPGIVASAFGAMVVLAIHRMMLRPRSAD
jgi:uncharacterized membrane protein YeaQ/YmgE (transglycosylase-associated protein family)